MRWLSIDWFSSLQCIVGYIPKVSRSARTIITQIGRAISGNLLSVYSLTWQISDFVYRSWSYSSLNLVFLCWQYQWIARHFGQAWVSKVILTCDKTIVHGDLLIDDKPKIKGRRQTWDRVSMAMWLGCPPLMQRERPSPIIPKTIIQIVQTASKHLGRSLAVWPDCITLHYKDSLGSIIGVEYCIPVPDFYLMQVKPKKY